MVTIEKIARASGVSPSTVSHVLGRRSHLFRAETRDKVMLTAESLGYRPNAAAKAVATGRFGGIALLLSTQQYRSSLPGGLLWGINAGLVDRDLQLSLAMLPDEKLTNEGFVPKLLRQLSADGLLVNYTDHIPSQMLDLIGRYKIPSVWINAKQPADCVHPDDFAAGRAATEHLLARGHRQIAYADFLHTIHTPEAACHYSVLDRRAGYVAAMVDAGLTPRLLLRSEREPTDEPSRIARAALSGPDRITAVVGYAIPSLNAIASEAEAIGLRVPADLSAITFNNGPATLGYRPATTLLVPDEAVGRIAVEMLNEKIDNPAIALPCQAVRFEFESGQSVAQAAVMP